MPNSGRLGALEASGRKAEHLQRGEVQVDLWPPTSRVSNPREPRVWASQGILQIQSSASTVSKMKKHCLLQKGESLLQLKAEDVTMREIQVHD